MIPPSPTADTHQLYHPFYFCFENAPILCKWIILRLIYTSVCEPTSARKYHTSAHHRVRAQLAFYFSLFKIHYSIVVWLISSAKNPVLCISDACMYVYSKLHMYVHVIESVCHVCICKCNSTRSFCIIGESATTFFARGPTCRRGNRSYSGGRDDAYVWKILFQLSQSQGWWNNTGTC